MQQLDREEVLDYPDAQISTSLSFNVRHIGRLLLTTVECDALEQK